MTDLRPLLLEALSNCESLCCDDEADRHALAHRLLKVLEPAIQFEVNSAEADALMAERNRCLTIAAHVLSADGSDLEELSELIVFHGGSDRLPCRTGGDGPVCVVCGETVLPPLADEIRAIGERVFGEFLEEADEFLAGCQCPPTWHGVVPPSCPVHNPAPPTVTTTSTGDMVDHHGRDIPPSKRAPVRCRARRDGKGCQYGVLPGICTYCHEPRESR